VLTYAKGKADAAGWKPPEIASRLRELAAQRGVTSSAIITSSAGRVGAEARPQPTPLLLETNG
jgi:hypothetical protein